MQCIKRILYRPWRCIPEGGSGGPGLGPVNAFTTENVKRHLLTTELNTRRTDKGFGVSSKEGLTL